ncbi:hypothetical protein [Nocardia brasiliensis]|uniref:hypothetical protein n=1 Tax=Nocardia brasiliensis TaxID=37326 RepID=UPI0024556008|nr:hypothetical protein [Nocardia brasiliensis]
MPNAMKRKGDAYELALVKYLRAKGFPGAERTRAGYQRDGGDLHLDPIVGTAPGVIGQAKNVLTPRWREWLTELSEQITNARAQVGFLIWKRRGITDPAQQLAVMPLREFLILLRLAGFGTPLDIWTQCEDCGGRIDWIACPTGGWWAHADHPADGHDAVTSMQVDEDMNERGEWITARNQKKGGIDT